MNTPAEQLSDFVHGLRYSDLPREVGAMATRALVDTVGVGLAVHDMKFARIMTDLVAEWGGAEESTVMATGRRVPAPNAILANGNLVHGVDWDNTHGEGLAHVSACVIPTALAVAEKVGANGEALIEAIVAGTEVQGRIAAAAAPNFHARGFHATFVTGCFGAAATAGKLLGLSPEQLTNALGICGTQTSGSFEYLEEGTWAKRFGPGWAGHAGTIAALMAARGYTGPRTIFEGRFGFYRSHVGDGNYRIERLTRGLGSEWETLGQQHKRYPCCHATHSSINAVKALRREHAIDPEDIAGVECLIQPELVALVCEPQAGKRRPSVPYQAQFSIYYEVATAFLRGAVDLDDFTEERIQDSDTLRLAERVRYTVNDAEAHNPSWPGTVIVRLRDGRELRQSDGGDLVHPMTDADIAEKFRRNARRCLPDGQAERLLGALANAASATTVRDMMSLTARVPAY